MMHKVIDKNELRGELFRHLDGLVAGPVLFALHERGVLDYLLDKRSATLDQISTDFEANDGYLNVGLRTLSAQGWLEMSQDNDADQVTYAINEKSKLVFDLAPEFADLVGLIKYSANFHPRKFEKAPFLVLHRIMQNFLLNDHNSQVSTDLEREVRLQIRKHKEGMLVGPTIVALGMGGMFHKYFMEASFRPEEFHEDADSFSLLLDFFVHLGWYTKGNGTYSFTEKGLFFAKRASSYGVTVSYMPTFRNLDEIIFGNPLALWNTKEGQEEKHVDRSMNVWGSGGAHGPYFKKIDEVIISIFNRPIQDQPRGILDMGCGNGAFLKHIFEVIEQRTTRGTMLEEHPLFLVGADFNAAALKATRATLIEADIWAKVIFGDIGNPDALASDLLSNYNIQLEDLLNVRSFLDHNRIWEDPVNPVSRPASLSQGAFAFRGKRLNPNLVESNLINHFQRWLPYVKKFGLLIIELHSLSPALISNHIGITAATAYDASHGFSDQYIMELEVFRKIIEESGLYADPRFSSRYPNSELATVSIHLLRGS